MNTNILWVDDEIEFLKPHILFLKKKGYKVTTSTNGPDAIFLIKESMGKYDLVILDEIMIGMDGLTTLKEIKKIDSSIFAIMLTKSEEEKIFTQAIGNYISDYLTKPVSLMQLYLTCKKNIDRKKLIKEELLKKYIENFNKLSTAVSRASNYSEWLDISHKIFHWSIQIETIEDDNLSDSFYKLKDTANEVFGNFIEKNYQALISQSNNENIFSPDIFPKFVIPKLKEKKKIVFLLIDSLRYDQLLELIELMKFDYTVDTSAYMSILPTTSIFSRNSIFAGLFPDEIEKKYPQIYENHDNLNSHDLYEYTLLKNLFQKENLEKLKIQYLKISRHSELKNLEKKINDYKKLDFLTIVIDFIEFLAHDKAERGMVSEMLSTDQTYRATVKNWFEHSSIKNIIEKLVNMGFEIVITSDHGAIKAKKYTILKGDGKFSSGIRYKFGKNLSSSNKKQTYIVQSPSKIRLPRGAFKGKNIAISKENNYFVYEKNRNDFISLIRDTYQHGGISLDEMILPVLTLRSKKKM